MDGGRATVRLFGPARTAFGRAVVEVAPGTVADLLADLLTGASDDQAAVVATCGRWVNGAPAVDGTPVGEGDELALLPPVSGGCGGRR